MADVAVKRPRQKVDELIDFEWREGLMALRADVSLIVEFLFREDVRFQGYPFREWHTFLRVESIRLRISATLHFTTLQNC